MGFTLLLSGNKGAKMRWGSGNVGDKWRTKPIKIESGWEMRSTHTKIKWKGKKNNFCTQSMQTWKSRKTEGTTY